MARRWLAVAGLALVAGCSLKDAFSGHQDVVATAAGQQLTVDRVATAIAPAKQVPLKREVVDRIADMWVDYQLLAQAIASGDSLLDSATVEAASWPVVVQQLVSGYHDSVVKKIDPTPAQIDSIFNGDDYRWVSHILVAVRGDTTAAVKAAKRRIAQGYLDQLKRGGDFATLARRVTEDPGSRENGGAYFITRGAMVKPFEDAAFALRPGELSPTLVETAFGYHLMWRPTLAQVRDSVAVKVEEIFSGRADSLFLDSLTNKTGIRVVARAPAIVKGAAADLRGAKTRNRTLASWNGGTLTEREFALWLQAFPQNTLAMVGQAPDSTLNEFVKSIARNEMLVTAARARHIAIGQPQRDSIRMRYREDLMTMLHGMGISAESLAADTASRSMSKATVAARHVDAYFTAITTSPGSRQYYAVPSYLADVLRAHASWKVNASGVDRALDRAKTLRGPETPSAPNGMPTMTPAPGGPPVGGRPAPGQPGGPPLRTIR